VVDPNGVASERTFDNLGRLLTTTIKAIPGCNTTLDALCANDITTILAYASITGPLLMEQRPRGGVTIFAYDTRGRVFTRTRGPSVSDLRERTEYTYDALTGKKSLERTLAYETGTWVEKHRQSFAYDIHARLQTVTHADNATVHYTYDAEDRVATIRDENHASPNTAYSYDSAGRLQRVTQTLTGAPLNTIRTLYSYDTSGNLTEVTDPNGNVTSYAFDDFGQMASQQSPATGTTEYVYDRSGNLTQMTDANEATTTRVYDALSRVTSATSTRGVETETVAWSYDDATAGRFAIGRLSSMTDPSGSTAYHYERRGMLRQETKTILGSTYVQSYAYDADGNRTSIGYPSGRVVTYAFDDSGRPLSATGTMGGQNMSYVTAAAYLPFGPMTSLTLGNGATETRTYNARYLPLSIQLTHAAITLAHYTYSSDPAGNITGITDAIQAGYNRTFGYDDLHRLTTANSGNSLWGTGSFTYDRMGNMLTGTLGGVQRTFTHQGTTPRINTATGLATNMSYDAAGNELKSPAGDPGAGDAAIYSPRNLLQSQFVRSYDRCFEQYGSACIQPDPVEEWRTNVYDGRGLRVLSTKIIVARTISIGDPEPQPDVYFYTPELSMLNLVSTTTGRTADVIWFASRPVADHGSGTPRYTLTDHLGTPILQTTPTGGIVWHAEYEPFGNVYSLRAGTDADDQPLRFPGQQVAYRTSEGEESYNIFRWYRSGWGRYTQVDPLAPQGTGFFTTSGMLRFERPKTKRRLRRAEIGEPEPLTYGYAADNPIGYIDPTGLKVLKCKAFSFLETTGATKNCYMIGYCTPVFGYSFYVTYGKIWIHPCWDCPKSCEYTLHSEAGLEFPEDIECNPPTYVKGYDGNPPPPTP
jgi:RHS repeat-associated protein